MGFRILRQWNENKISVNGFINGNWINSKFQNCLCTIYVTISWLCWNRNNPPLLIPSHRSVIVMVMNVHVHPKFVISLWILHRKRIVSIQQMKANLSETSSKLHYYYLALEPSSRLQQYNNNNNHYIQRKSVGFVISVGKSMNWRRVKGRIKNKDATSSYAISVDSWWPS